MPANLRSPIMRSFGHLMAASTPETEAQADRAASPAAAVRRCQRGIGRPSGPEQHRDEQSRPGPGLPTSFEASPPGRLEIRSDNQALGSSLRGQLGHEPVGGLGHIEKADVTEPGLGLQAGQDSLIE